MIGTGLQEFLQQLQQNYQILREREAKYATAAPLDLLNQLDDYAYALELAQQALKLNTPLEQLQAEFNGLNLELNRVVFISQEPPRKPFTGRNPYRGLLKFTEEDADLFFGRNDAIQNLLNNIQRLVDAPSRPEAPDLITVLGPSGSGKSSLVRAGVIPALKAGRLPGSERWPTKVMMPGAHPFNELAALFVEPTGRGLPALRADLQGGEQALYQLMLESLARAGLSETGEFVLVIDQFEEVFTLCADRQEREAFLNQLLYVAMQNRGFIILTMRADFYDKVASYKRLAAAITVNQMLVSPMSEKELREAILLPAEAVGLELEKALVETLLNDTADSPGVLPLLQQALTELFHYRDGNLLTLDAYEKIGGVKGALAYRADAVLDSMPIPQRHTVRRIFMRLVTLGEGASETRRRATLPEVIPQGSDPAEIESIIKVLADANLVITGLDQESGEVVLDVSHEVLIKEWPRFQSWLDWDRRGLRIRQQLSQAAREWEARGQEEDSLYRGSRLLEAEEWIAANPGEINPVEDDFIRTSARVRDRAEMERRRLARMIIAGLSVGLILVALGAVYGFVGQGEARKAEAVANEKQYAAQTAEARAVAGEQQALAQSLAARALPILETTNNSELAGLLAVEAAALNRQGRGNAQALIDRALRAIIQEEAYFKIVLSGPQAGLFAAAISPNGQTLAAAGQDGLIYAWDLARPVTATIAGQHQAPIQALAFRPPLASEPGRTVLAAAGDDGVIRLWDLANPGAAPLQLPGAGEGVLTLAFSPDGQTLASAGANGATRLWDLANPGGSPQQVLDGEGSDIWDLAFSPDGQTLAAASGGGSVRLWDLAGAEADQQVLDADQLAVFSLAFSPDGQRLAAAGSEGLVKLWQMADLAAAPRVLKGHERPVRTLAFSPDGQTLASAGFDQSIRLWDLNSRFLAPQILNGHDKAVRAVVFSPDGQTLASTGDDGNVRLWRPTNPAARRPPLAGHASSVAAVAFQPVLSGTARLLASAGDDGQLLLWDLATEPATASQLWQDQDILNTLAFSPNGQTLAASGDSAVIRLWNLAEPGPFPAVLPGHRGGTLAVAFSPDGLSLASGGSDNLVRLWDPANPGAEPVNLAGHQQPVRAVAFSPDGQSLASASFDGTVRLWNPADPTADPVIFTGHENSVLAVAFSPDGRTLASAGSDTTVRLWQTDDPRLPPAVLRGHEDNIFALAFSPDGQTLASASLDQTIRLWNVADPAAAPVLLNRDKTGAVRAIAFSPDGQTLASAGDDPAIRLWLARIDSLARLVCGQVQRNLTALEWQQFLGQAQPYRRTCPEQPVHYSLVEAALDLARIGQIEPAVDQLRHLAALDPGLGLDPAAAAEQAFQDNLQKLLTEGRVLARQGDVEQAAMKFSQALALNPELGLDPAAEAERLAADTAQNLVEGGLDLARQGDLEGAVDSFRQAQQRDPGFEISAEQWHNLCIQGSQSDQAELVLESCNMAIQLEPDNGLYYNSRGLIRALVGDRAGAAADFRIFQEWLEKNPPEE